MRSAAALMLALALLPASGSSHESRPLHVEVLEQTPTSWVVRWRTPESVPAFNRPRVALPPGCTPRGGPVRSADVEQQRWSCAERLAGAPLSIRYPAFNPSLTTLIRLRRVSGEAHTAVLGPDESEWRVPAPESRGRVSRQYLGLGARHILEGVDHLLFLACLIYLARTPRRILVTVTGFTLAHSLTLALAGLGLVRLPVPPVEAAIALSIVLVATEIARNRRDGIAWRRPIAVSTSFGLLHGFGFAGVLRGVGLPQTELPAALLFFNLGVEVGQLLFVVALVAAWWLLRRLAASLRPLSAEALLERLRLPVGYAVGWASSYWLIARLAGF